ncbi:Synaptotagmin-11 [Saguinus oedipus]|uniref:Synaptotagmin-11 n=1 Tax=Saguinus oedipus TaxID=9490 RepID=A0ABQ9TIB1_SAGOE|nr:Synaptotagmin-11 [Saguinus oedipus]
MAEITNIRPSFDVSPVVAGLIGASVLVVCVSVTIFVWSCCHQQAEKKHKNPPYKFIHMLKGISIYPETLSNKKKIIKVRRDKDGREGGRGNLLVDAAEAGLLSQDKGPRGPSSGSCIDQLPIKMDYGEELRSPMTSLTPGESKTTSPSSPEEDVMLGSLTFSVDYNFPKKALVVTIQEAHGLPVMDDQTQGSDPYIKMTILPDKRHRVKTRVLRKTLDPVFDETFTFYGIPYSQLQDLVLHFLVLSFDRFSRDDVIGEVMVPLAGVDPSTGKVQLTRDIIKRNIQEDKGGPNQGRRFRKNFKATRNNCTSPRKSSAYRQIILISQYLFYLQALTGFNGETGRLRIEEAPKLAGEECAEHEEQGLPTAEGYCAILVGDSRAHTLWVCVLAFSAL